MIFRAFNELISTFPAVFWSELSPPDTVRLLAKELENQADINGNVGARIDGTKVFLHKRRSLIGNPFAPIFDGEIRAAESGSQLVGTFRRRRLVLLICGLSYFVVLPVIPFILIATPLMAIWLGVSASWGIFAGALAALTLTGAMFAVAAIALSAMYAATRDSKEISNRVEAILLRAAV